MIFSRPVLLTLALLFIVGPVRAQVPAPPKRPLPVKVVFAHYMVCCPAAGGGATLDDLKHEIMAAQSRGLDGFALNCGGWFDGYRQRCVQMYEAARQLGTGFQLAISVDYCCGNGLKETADAIDTFRDHPNQFRYDGKPVLFTWGGESRDAKTGQAKIALAHEKGALLVPYFYPTTYHEQPTPEDVDQLFHDYGAADGYYYFAAVGNGEQITTSNHRHALKWMPAGKIFMAGVSPFYRSFGRLNETNGFTSMAQEWEGAIADDVNWILISTWNDWNEKTYVAPFGTPENTVLWDGTNPDMGTINYAHVAYLDASRYYIDWFKTGIRPKITEDKLFYFYRTEPRAASGKQLSSNEKARGVAAIAGAESLQDKVFVSAFLSSPATLTIQCGAQKQSFPLQAGVSHVEMPFAPGKPHFVLVRDGKVVIDKVGEQEIKDQQGETRYNYFGGEATP